MILNTIVVVFHLVSLMGTVSALIVNWKNYDTREWIMVCFCWCFSSLILFLILIM